MGVTVENSKKTVVNKGTPHTAKSNDPCLNGTYENCAKSKNLAALASVRTTIQNHPIAMEFTIWNPSESAGKVGVVTGQTQSMAVVTMGSRNLKIEGRWAARKDDKTSQNFFNSNGKVHEGDISPNAKSLEEQAKEKCFLENWEATSDVSGGVLGFKGKPKDRKQKPDWLEVWDTETVTFNATRKDITDPGHAVAPTCEADPQHCIWQATGTLFPSLQTKVTKDAKGVDTWKVSAGDWIAGWANAKFMDAAQKAAQGDGDAMDTLMAMMANKYLTNDGDQRGPQNAQNPDTGGDYAGAGTGLDGNPSGGMGLQDYGVSGSINAAHKHAEFGKTFGADGKQGDTRADGDWRPKKDTPLIVDLKTVLYYFWWWMRAPTISVKASSCGGERSAKIRIHPNQIVKHSFKLEKPARAAVNKAQDKASNKADQLDRRAQQHRDALEKAKAAEQANKATAGSKLAQQEKIKQLANDVKAQNAPGTRDWQEGEQKWLESVNLAVKFGAQFDRAVQNIKQIESQLSMAKKICNTTEKIAKIAKQPLKLTFLKDLSIDIRVSFERTEDKPSALWSGHHYTPAMMGQKWQFRLQVKPLIAVQYTAYFSLLNFCTFYAPGTAQLLRKLRIFRVDMYFMIRLSISVNGITITKEKHDDLTLTGPSIDSDIVPRLGLVVGAGGVDIIDGYFSVPINFRLQFVKSDKKGVALQGIPTIRITNHYRVVVFPDRWWEVEAVSGQMRGLRYSFNSEKRRADLIRYPA